MKYKITMLCNENQFKNIKPKLNGKVSFSMLSEFNNHQKFYLINHLGKDLSVTNVTSPKDEKEVARYEEWNENIFLDACGIEVEKTFSITESQIKEVNEFFLMHKSKESSSKLKEWFPEAFESEVKLQSGKWYKHPDYPKFLTCLREDKTRFGIDVYGNWFDDGELIKDEHQKAYKEATEQEVFEALKNEAVKRGYKEGVFVKGMDDSSTEVLKGKFTVVADILKIKNKGLTVCDFSENDFTSVDIFRNGQWAEIISTITLSEAEQQLGKKIIV